MLLVGDQGQLPPEKSSLRVFSILTHILIITHTYHLLVSCLAIVDKRPYDISAVSLRLNVELEAAEDRRIITYSIVIAV